MPAALAQARTVPCLALILQTAIANRSIFQDRCSPMEPCLPSTRKTFKSFRLAETRRAFLARNQATC